MFPSLNEYGDLSAPLFKHGVKNNKALARTMEEGKDSEGFMSLHLDIQPLLLEQTFSTLDMTLLLNAIFCSGQHC